MGHGPRVAPRARRAVARCNDRPGTGLGVAIVAVIATVYGIFRLLLTLLGLAGMALASAGMPIQHRTGTLLCATASDLILNIGFLAFGMGALPLKGWSWVAGMVALALEVAGELVAFVPHGSHAHLLTMQVLAVVIFWYLVRLDVRSAFGKPA